MTTILQPQLFIRFYGRFVFVLPKPDRPHLTALAINLPDGHNRNRPDSSDRGSCHQCFLCIREEDLAPGSLQSDQRIMGTDVIPFKGSLNLWNLEKYTIDIESHEKTTDWHELCDVKLADLGQLSGSEVAPRFLGDVPEDPVIAIIRIPGGRVDCGHLLNFDTRIDPKKPPCPQLHALLPIYQYVDLDPPHTAVPGDLHLADLVQVTMSLPANGVGLSVSKNGKSRTPIRICRDYFPVQEKQERSLQDSTPMPAAIVSFSNLCSAGDPQFIDTEFAGYYRLLKGRPSTILVPKVADDSLTKKIVANASCRVGDRQFFIPFGNCFLGAKI